MVVIMSMFVGMMVAVAVVMMIVFMNVIVSTPDGARVQFIAGRRHYVTMSRSDGEAAQQQCAGDTQACQSTQYAKQDRASAAIACSIRGQTSIPRCFPAGTA